jgi:hypothetical protein
MNEPSILTNSKRQLFQIIERGKPSPEIVERELAADIIDRLHQVASAATMSASAAVSVISKISCWGSSRGFL